MTVTTAPAVDLLIHLRAWDKDKAYYPLEAWTDDGSHYSGEGFSIEEAPLREVERDAQAYGLYLFYRLFTGAIRRAYDKATGQAQAQGAALRLRLWIDPEASALHALAWERLHCTRQGATIPLAATGDVPFSRHVSLEQAEPSPFSQRPVRLLFALASPANLERYRLAPLVAEAEVANLLDAVEALLRGGALHLTLLTGQLATLSPPLRQRLEQAGVTCVDEPTTLANVVRLLSEAGGQHIFHFLGHGHFNQQEGAAALFFEGQSGNAHIVRDAEIAARFQSLAAAPRLVFLAACESAKYAPAYGNAFVGLAPQLVAAGIPAVVAMQDVLPIVAAQRLTRNFYRYLLEHGSVDRALNQSRLVIYDQQQMTWAIPTLFMRLRQGQLFTADPTRAVLTALAAAEVFNPLPADGAYLPLQVLHFAGAVAAAELERLEQEISPGRGLVEAVFDILSPLKAEIAPHGPSCVALIGGAGMGKSTALRQLGQATIHHALTDGAAPRVIPVYICLDGLSQEPVLGVPDILRLIREALAPFCPADLPPAALLEGQNGPTLRVLVDGGDNLPDHVRRRAWQSLTRVIYRHSRHEYIVALLPDQIESRQLPITDTLVMQLLSPRHVRDYLMTQLATPAARNLYQAIEAAQLFDLAAQPWLLFKMLKQTGQGRMPQTHAQVLQNLVDDAIAEIAPDRGMRARATRTLYALARQMQFSFRSTLPVDEAFQVLAEQRKNRGYSLELLYQALIQREMLQPVGEEALRFARANIRAYGCAQAILQCADFERRLDDITATLGRHTRYRWWEDTLVFLSGLMDDPNVLLRQLLYGVALHEGEQLFLAARCIPECRARLDAQLVHHVIRMLIWRLDSARELRTARRVRIAEILGQLQAQEALPRLIRVACERVRLDAQQQPIYEHNSVRLAAVEALQRSVAPPYAAIKLHSPQAATILNYWAAGQVEALVPYLVAPGEQYEGVQSLAAFALGDLQTARAVEVIIRAFLSPKFSDVIRAAAATALTLLDPAVVTQRVLFPLLDAEAAQAQGLPPETWENRRRWYPELADLIGQLRIQQPQARAFLYQCLNDYPDIELKGAALRALGHIYDYSSKDLCETIALWDAERLKPLARMNLLDLLNLPASPTPEARDYLQRQALEALYYLGDAETLRRLQCRPTSGSPELELAFYWAIEEILARQNAR